MNERCSICGRMDDNHLFDVRHTNPTKAHQSQVNEALLAAITEAEARLAKVQVWLATMAQDADKADWRHVGDVNHVGEMLEEITEFIRA